ncbi:hypothetical protein OHA61_33960 [Streptomyces sp. NBC_00885]|uniref:hypothetical protein n=1 Tax=Streptomyces sp. NBC_00885 TaxID=2975857 RepID=UPI00386CF809|nr:hypothetical protein OHA61_33960 [Streptomyces sp. NBC_00885]
MNFEALEAAVWDAGYKLYELTDAESLKMGAVAIAYPLLDMEDDAVTWKFESLDDVEDWLEEREEKG